MRKPRSFTLKTPKGLTLHGCEWRGRSSSVCVLLHGFGHDCRSWDALASALHGRHRVIALDFCGHGDSDWDRQGEYSYADLLRDLSVLVDAKQLQRFHLIGHSLGAQVATLFAAAHPQQLASLTLIDCGPVADDRAIAEICDRAEQQPPYFDSPEAYYRWLRARQPLARRSALLHRAAHGLRTDGRKHAGQLRWRTKTDPGFSRALWRSGGRAAGGQDGPLSRQLWTALDEIRCQTLVVRGQLSSILSAPLAEQMATARLQRGQLSTVPLAGHAVLQDNPDACSAAITQFIEGIQPPQRERKRTLDLTLIGGQLARIRDRFLQPGSPAQLNDKPALATPATADD